MADEPNETLAPADTTTVPKDNGSQDADAAALKSELNKMEMERNLLRKQKDALEKEKAERERKELEEKEDYRSLAEQAKAEAESLRKEKEDAEAKQATEKATADVFKEFPENVQKVAQTAGLRVQSDTEESRASLKAKLEAIQKEVGTTAPRVQGSNPAPSTEPAFDAVKTGKLMRVDDRNLREPAIKDAIIRHPQVQAFKDFAMKANNLTPQAS